MGRLISNNDRLLISFESDTPNRAWAPILNVPEYTKKLGMFGVINIDKKKQLQKGYTLNCNSTAFFDFINYKHLSYSQLEKLDKVLYRTIRRISVFLWILDGYLTKGEFDNPITAFLNDKFIGHKPFWVCHPGTTREAIHYLYDNSNVIDALSFVPHSYKYTDYTFKYRFTNASEVEKWLNIVTPDYKTNGTNLPAFRGFLYNTRNFGISMEPCFINHIDDNDKIHRSKYHDIARQYFSNHKISVVSENPEITKICWEKNLNLFVKPEDADVVIYLRNSQTRSDLDINFMRCILALPLLKKHPQLFDIIERFGDRIKING